MSTYHIDYEEQDGILRVGFGKPAQGDKIIKDADKKMEELIRDGTIAGGKIIRINGAASLAVAMLLGHRLSHLYQAVAIFDPKLAQYVVTIAHGDKYCVGDLLE